MPDIKNDNPAPLNNRYPLSAAPVDVVIPCVEKDTGTLEQCIEGIRTNGRRIRRIIVVAERRLSENAEHLAETVFPFNKEKIAFRIQEEEDTGKYIQNPNNRSGWILQQLFKFYSPLIVPDISPNVLVLDADTIFLKPVSFLNPLNGAYFTESGELHEPYFRHAERLIPGFQKVLTHSAVAHHMLLQKPAVLDLFAYTEAFHKKPFWQTYCDCIDPKMRFGSPCSEYEIYANFVCLRSAQFEVRSLKWRNSREPDNLTQYRDIGYDFISCHAYLRTPA